MKKLLTVQQVAELIQVAPITIYKWISAGKIPYTKLPSGSVRFDPDKLQNWINNRTVRVK